MNFEADKLRSDVMCAVQDFSCEMKDHFSALVEKIDKEPVKAVTDLADDYLGSIAKLRASILEAFPQPENWQLETDNETKEAEPEAESKPIKRPRLPKFEALSAEEKESVLKAKLDFASQTRNMPLGEIKSFMPDALKRVHPYSTVYNKFTEPLLKHLEANGVRTPATMADFPFSQLKALILKEDPSIGNGCINAFLGIYGIKFAPEKTSWF